MIKSTILFFSIIMGHLFSSPAFIEPIDVVIPCTDKDLATLELCIEGIKKNGANIRRVIVISDRPLTTKAEWFDESLFPFTKKEVAYYLNGCDLEESKQFVEKPGSRNGWYFQQLLKLYAPYVIPDLSSHVLLLDSDTIFLNPVDFLGAEGQPLYNIGSEYHIPYFEHMDRFLPGLKRVFPGFSGICHHMLIQKITLDDLFSAVESKHNNELWKVFCTEVDRINPVALNFSGASEYEIYFNYIFSHGYPGELRPLKWANSRSLSQLEAYKKEGYHYVSCHAYFRK